MSLSVDDNLFRIQFPTFMQTKEALNWILRTRDVHLEIMTLQIDLQTGLITRDDRAVGRVEEVAGNQVIHLELPLSSHEEVAVALSWLATGLKELGPSRPKADLTISTSDDSIAEEFSVPRFLTEKQVKRGGYVWEFHKSDVDPWPSKFHAHDYEKGLKLDVLSGNVYDVGTRELCKRLKPKVLSDIVAELRGSKDFCNKVAEMIGPAKQ